MGRWWSYCGKDEMTRCSEGGEATFGERTGEENQLGSGRLEGSAVRSRRKEPNVPKVLLRLQRCSKYKSHFILIYELLDVANPIRAVNVL